MADDNNKGAGLGAVGAGAGLLALLAVLGDDCARASTHLGSALDDVGRIGAAEADALSGALDDAGRALPLAENAAEKAAAGTGAVGDAAASSASHLPDDLVLASCTPGPGLDPCVSAWQGAFTTTAADPAARTRPEDFVAALSIAAASSAAAGGSLVATGVDTPLGPQVDVRRLR